MGYSTVTLVSYGIEIKADGNEDKLQELEELLKDFDAKTDDELDDLNDNWDGEWADKYQWEDGEDYYGKSVCFKGDEADGRCSNTNGYGDSYSYVFGIGLAEGNKKINKLIRNTPESAKKRWEELCVPLLEKVGLEIGEPDVVIITQTW